MTKYGIGVKAGKFYLNRITYGDGGSSTVVRISEHATLPEAYEAKRRAESA